MNTKYIDLIDQSFYFPQEEFKLEGNQLEFHDIDLMALVKEYGAPLKFSYLPKISENINRAKGWFADAIAKHNYKGSYNYCYCTKSSHFKHVLDEALKNDIHIETSSAFDINIVNKLKENGKITEDTFVICNGFKRDQYINNIADLINGGQKNCIPIIDNYEEINLLTEGIKGDFKIGIRIASEEEPKFEFYTSRLGIGYKNIVPFYEEQIKNNDQVDLKMLHFFINTGIRDNAYYWNELNKCLKVYIRLKKICPSLDSLNIGGGFPIKNSLAFDYDYAYMVDEIINQIKITCDEADVPVPNIFTEFGSFTVGESGGAIYEVLYQKQQNDREKWNMINSSFITTLPDTWAISKRFIMLPVNRWDEEYERVLLGGLTCDSDDYYNSEQHSNAIYLPRYKKDKPLYIGFFNTGAYQETIGGYGGLQHCLIPQPKHILIDRDENGNLTTRIFNEQQKAEQLLKILGYEYN
ncbi:MULTISPECIES: arginine decarboxylase [Leeuwenhoekiella]|uniref:Arginine decarboxylase n=1 Tax=Leeuwenhoekiella palythoae TaxID=573501 RepID=A0A1M5ZP37_9FLAO|nr:MULTISPECIES: arginine decarboxylase [Leeuwenhoekiella]MEC7782972.1 arginine decarboxylase [Bacteroidota bacterium]HBO28934.1 arginine decarboxylase [Leeuwenhoekiella sp.]MEE3146533.1 arginine decarboxylase [Bacteroidota bacterium]MEE3227323.1 arginine decarboxylase [Bacteroidota bacterium]MEE3243771.1 arginine decarboxylase [Bacteroidota bacterium]|tara:strand:+ start:827 stop:2227 length:1401 start_codon:yes stop_codon:yes gene_type:complete